MPLQNRVTPTNHIVATSGRGMFMGNRGCLHDENRTVVRGFVGQRWIACVTEFQGRRRELMTPGKYTELFFLDEATALAAGHRPCAECRREAFRRFKCAWVEGNQLPTSAAQLTAVAIDQELHRARLTDRGRQRTFRAILDTLPAGVFVREGQDGEPCLWWEGQLHRWTVEMRYITVPAGNPDREVEVLTPAPTVCALRGGYVPVVRFA